MDMEQIHPGKLRAILWFALSLGFACLLAGCIAVGPPAFSYETQERGNRMCADLYTARAIQNLHLKMPILPGEKPTRDMLMIREAPSPAETQAIGALETAIRNCKSLRAASGFPTTASEDILEARVSRLRFALYKGDIPFAVYNYGVAQALKKHTAFMVQGERAYSQGKAAGTAKMADMGLGQISQAYQRYTSQSPRTGPGWVCTDAGCQ